MQAARCAEDFDDLVTGLNTWRRDEISEAQGDQDVQVVGDPNDAADASH
jgi:hypothetical protein